VRLIRNTFNDQQLIRQIREGNRRSALQVERRQKPE
jgi:hypothetical protein